MTPEEWADHWTSQADVCWVMAESAERCGEANKAAELRRLARKAERSAWRWSTNMVGG